MNPKWVGFLAFVWIIGVLWGSSYEASSTFSYATGATATTPQSTLNYLLNYQNIVYQQPVFGNLTFPMPNTQYFLEWLRVGTMNFYFLDGDLVVVQWFLQIFGICGIVAFIYTVFTVLTGFVPSA